MKFKTDKSTLDNHLLAFGIAFKPKKAEVTWTTTPPGELDIERYFIAQDPACFRTTRIVNEGIQLKTIVLADPTLNGTSLESAPVLNTHRFLLHLYRNYPDAQVYIWTNTFHLLKNANEFLNLYQLSAPLSKSEFEGFKKLQQLNNDEIKLLDQTNLYSFSNVIHIHFAIKSYNRKYNGPNYDEVFMPRLILSCQYFTSEQLMDFDESMLKKVLDWHQEYNHPLHIRISGFAEKKIIGFIEESLKYPQLIIYFEDITRYEWEIWYPYLCLIPQKQIIGLKRTSKNDSYAPHVDAIVLEFIQSLKDLKYLFFEMDYLTETSIKTLNFSLNNQLEYLYLSTKNIPVKNNGNLKEQLSKRTTPNQNDVNTFLFSLPKGIKNLHLPYLWTYSLRALTSLLTHHFYQLKYLGTNMEYDIKNVIYNKGSFNDYRPMRLNKTQSPSLYQQPLSTLILEHQ